MRIPRWTPESMRSEFLAIARRLGRTPRQLELPEGLVKAMGNHRLSLRQLAAECGLTGCPVEKPAPRPVAPKVPCAMSRRDLTRERRASRRRQNQDHADDWKRGTFRTLGVGPRLAIMQPGPNHHMPFAAPDDLIHSKRIAA